MPSNTKETLGNILLSPALSLVYFRISIGEYNGDKYLQILSLVGLQEQRWPEELLTRSAMALVLLGILRASGYFGVAKISSSAQSYTPNELFIGSLILKHLQVIYYLNL